MEKRVKLLAPGGDIRAAKAALLAGVDAIYCGLPQFNARRRAENLTMEQLSELVRIAHHRGSRVYLTLNTVLLENELDIVIDLLNELQRMDIDAVIVQDWGLLKLVRDSFPSLAVHASTQLTTHNAGQIALLARLGVSSVNLCRELSLQEIRDLCTLCNAGGMASEVFVHGAYCIAFSGQCYMSSAMSGRSGNRGECAQPCRKSYYCRGQTGRKPVMNLKDLSAFPLLPELVESGVRALKIEGRMRNYRYVYTVVSSWRRQIDRYYENGTAAPDDASLHSVFNRSFSCGYLKGEISSAMFADSSRDRSLIPIGTVRSYTADTATLHLEPETRIAPGTPVRIYTDGFTFVCTGVIDERTGRHSYRFRITHKLRRKISHGDLIFRQATLDGSDWLEKRISKLREPKIKATVAVSGDAGAAIAAANTSTRPEQPQLKLVIDKPPPSGKPPSLAVLVDKAGELHLPHASTTRILLELPINAGSRIDYFSKIFEHFEGLIPWFPAILIGEQFISAVRLIRRIRPEFIVTDNSGIGYAAAEAGIPWVAGPLLNSANSLSLRALYEYGGCCGAFISHELSRNQMKAVSAPSSDFSRWFTVFAPLLLMNTRQCIARNCTDCGKDRFDRRCIESCAREIELLDEKKNPFFVVKRPGFYNQVYNGRHYYNPVVIRDADPDNAVFLVDLRAIPSKTTLCVTRNEFVGRIEEAVSGRMHARNNLRSLAQMVTAGQYIRGLRQA